MNRTRNVLIGLMATSTLAVPLATATTADAAARPRPVVKVEPITDAWIGRAAAAFSPNGDHVKDKGRVAFKLAKKSEVTVKLRRTNKAETVVYKENLGKVTRGKHTWTWNGTNLNRKVVRDGSYLVVFTADQVADDGQTGRTWGYVHVDTKFDAQWKPEANTDTVYPRTLVIHDRVGLSLNNSDGDPMTALGAFETTFKDPQGKALSKYRSKEYHSGMYQEAWPGSFAGTFPKNEPLPAGAYTFRFKVWDLAGNPGGAKSLTVHVSDKALVEARGTIVVPPTGVTTATTLPPAPASAAARDGRSSTTGGDDPPRIPCGTVVPSEVYSETGAKSYRSSDACGDTWSRPAIATMSGRLDLSTVLTHDVAPRGVQLATVSMRGKPTVAGETDTARLRAIGYPNSSSVVSAAVAEETVTTTQARYEWDSVYGADYFWNLDWTIETTGNDSFDVADVAVIYHYLTPQAH
jgi:FlgD Ig-like domain